MAKFADIYRQELKSKGILSSLGSAALKGQRERNDIRNTLFGGKGILSSTGQKIFGKGYSALGGGAQKLSASDSSPQQTSAINALTISSQRQEGLLKIVAKNTMNMNMMARDMNITRQNIASMTKKMTGKSSKGADAMWMGADKRNAFFADKKTPTNTKQSSSSTGGGLGGIFSGIGSAAGGIFSGIGSVIAGGAGIVGSVVSGLLGTVGSVGGGILSMIGGILSGVPGGWLLGTIAVAGVAYLLKEVYDNVDFSKLKDDILKGLGLDPDNKEKTLKQQILEKLGFSTEKSKSISDSIENFDEEMKKIFQPAADKFELYTKAAFTTLAKIFENVGKTFGFIINDFFADNKIAIITALAVGVGLMGGVTLGAGAIAGIVAGLGAGLVLGKATANLQSPDSLKNTINTLDKLEQLQKEIDDNATKRDIAGINRFSPISQEIRDQAKKDIETHKANIIAKEKEIRKIQDEHPLAGIDLEGNNVGFQDPTGSRRKMLGELRDKKLQERKEALKFNPIDIFKEEVNKNSPSRLSTNQKIGNYRISSPFGIRLNPVTGQMESHEGIDIAMPKGTPLYAIVDGKIVAVGNNSVAGNFVTLKDSKGTEYTYSHLDSTEVTEGQEVKQGNLIGKSGNTGRSTAPHLHFGVKEQGKFREPVLQELQNAISQAQKISDASIENQDQRIALTLSDLAPSAPTVTNNYNTTNTSSGGNAVASVYNLEPLFVENMIDRHTAQA